MPISSFLEENMSGVEPSEFHNKYPDLPENTHTMCLPLIKKIKSKYI